MQSKPLFRRSAAVAATAVVGFAPALTASSAHAVDSSPSPVVGTPVTTTDAQGNPVEVGSPPAGPTNVELPLDLQNGNIPSTAIQTGPNAYELSAADSAAFMRAAGIGVGGASTSALALRPHISYPPYGDYGDICYIADVNYEGADYRAWFCTDVQTDGDDTFQGRTYYYAYKDPATEDAAWPISYVGFDQLDLYYNFFGTLLTAAQDGYVEYYEDGRTQAYLGTLPRYNNQNNYPAQLNSVAFEPFLYFQDVPPAAQYPHLAGSDPVNCTQTACA